jgi:hypothetical protein
MNVEFKGKRIFVNGSLFAKFVRGCKHCGRKHRIFRSGRYHSVEGYEMQNVINMVIDIYNQAMQ